MLNLTHGDESMNTSADHTKKSSLLTKSGSVSYLSNAVTSQKRLFALSGVRARPLDGIGYYVGRKVGTGYRKYLPLVPFVPRREPALYFSLNGGLDPSLEQ